MAKKYENLTFGMHPVLEAIRSDRHLEKVFIQKGLKGELSEELKKEVRNRDIPYSVVPPEKLSRFTKKIHQGVVAFVSPVQYYPLDQVISQTYEAGEVPLLILLDSVTDVRNFGSIARTAECLGAHAIIIPTKGSAQVNSDALKTSAGALNVLPVVRETNLNIALSELKQSGLKIMACTEKSEKVISKVDLCSPTCLVFGSEDVGISPELLAACDDRAKIPLFGKIESLNVGVAAGMVLYEVQRQRSE